MELPLFPITDEQVTPDVLALFDITKPTMPRALNVLEGLNRGQILIDDPAQPTTAVVRDAMYGTLYFGGNMMGDLLATVVLYFRKIGEVGIGCWLDEPLNDMLPTVSTMTVELTTSPNAQHRTPMRVLNYQRTTTCSCGMKFYFRSRLITSPQ